MPAKADSVSRSSSAFSNPQVDEGQKFPQIDSEQKDKIEQVRQAWYGWVTSYVGKLSAAIGSTTKDLGVNATKITKNVLYAGATATAKWYIQTAHGLLTMDKEEQLELYKNEMRESLDGDSQYVELFQFIQLLVNKKIENLIPKFFKGFTADIIGNEQIILDLLEINLAKGFASLAQQINENRDSIPNFDVQPMWLNAISYILRRSGSSFNSENFLKIEQEYQENYHQLDLTRNKLFSKKIHGHFKDSNFELLFRINESDVLLKISKDNPEGVEKNLEAYLNANDESAEMESINRLFFSGNPGTSFEQLRDANEAFKIILKEFSDRIPLFNPEQSEKLINEYLREKDEEKRFSLLTTLFPDALRENINYDRISKNFPFASDDFNHLYSKIRRLENYHLEIESLIGEGADLFVECLFPNKIADLNLLGLTSMYGLPERLYGFLRKFVNNLIRELYLNSKENFTKNLKLVEFAQKQLPSILDIDTQRRKLFKKTQSTFSADFAQGIAKDISNLLFNKKNKTRFIQEMLLEFDEDKEIRHIDVRLMEQAINRLARKKGQSLITSSKIIKLLKEITSKNKYLSEWTVIHEQTLKNSIESRLEQNRIVGSEERLTNVDIKEIIQEALALSKIPHDKKAIEFVEIALGKHIESFIETKGNSSLKPEDVLEAYITAFGLDDGGYQLNDREKARFDTLIKQMNAASFSEEKIIGYLVGVFASPVKVENRRPIIEKMWIELHGVPLDRNQFELFEKELNEIVASKGRARLTFSNRYKLLDLVKINGSIVELNKEQRLTLQKFIDSLIEAKGNQSSKEWDEEDLRVIFAQVIRLTGTRYTDESYDKGEADFIEVAKKSIAIADELAVKTGDMELRAEDILAAYLAAFPNDDYVLSDETKQKLGVFIEEVNAISLAQETYAIISNQIQGIFRSEEAFFAKNREFVDRLLEGLLLKVFTSIVAANHSSDKDILITLKEKMKPILANSFRELSHGENSLVVAKKMAEALAIALGLSEIVDVNGTQKLVPTKNFDWMPEQLHDLLMDKLPGLLEEHYLSNLKVLLEASDATNPSTVKAKDALKKLDEELQAQADEKLERVNAARVYVGKKPLKAKKANRSELSSGQVGSKIELVLLDLMKKAIPMIEDLISEKTSDGSSSNIFNTIGSAINVELNKWVDKDYKSADVLLNHGTNDIVNFLQNVSIDIQDELRNENNQAEVFARGVNLLAEPVNDIVDELRGFVKFNQGESFQRVIGGVIRSAATHVNIIHKAKEIARQDGRTKIKFDDLLKAGNANQPNSLISAALPTKSISFNKTIGAILGKYPELQGKEDSLRSVFRDLLNREKNNGEKIDQKKIFGLLESEEYLNRPIDSNEKKDLKKLLLLNLLREDATEHVRLRKTEALDPAFKALLKAFDVKNRLTMVKPEYRKQVWGLLKSNPSPDIMPKIMEKLLSPETIIKLTLNSLTSILNGLKGEIIVSKAQGSTHDASPSPNVGMLGESTGDLADEVLKSLELPWIVKKMLLGSDDKVRDSIKNMIGEQLVKTFNENLIDSAIHDIVESMLDKEDKEKVLVSGQSAQRAKDKKTQPGPSQLAADRKEIKEKSRELITASLSFLVRTCYAKAQFYIDEIIRRISTGIVNKDFAEFILLFKRRLTEVFEFLIFTIIGQTIQFCLTPLTKLVRYTGEKYLKIDDNLQSLMDLFLEMPEDQPEGYDYSVFHENLFYKAAQAGFEIYEEEKELQEKIKKNPKLSKVL